MGIPFYFKNLVNRHSEVIKLPKDIQQKCSRLFLDYNCVLHMCANKIVAKHPLLIGHELEELIMKTSIEYIHKLMKVCQPSDLLYIAIDGPCPFAKMVQQRKRRFISAWRREKLLPLMLKEGQNVNWDSNMITPGTDFMKRFNAYLRKHIEKTSFGKANLILTDSTEFGEGEHKIFKYIKDNPSPSIEDGMVDVVYGLDADLIMLSLVYHEMVPSASPLYLLREKPEFHLPKHATSLHDEFVLLDTQVFKESIRVEYEGIRILDYVILCALLGNDFIPSLSYLKIKENAIDTLIKVYQQTKELLNTTLVTSDNQINTQFIGMMMSLLAQTEDECMTEAQNTYRSKRYYGDRRFSTPLAQLSNEIDNYPSLHKFDKDIDSTKSGWRTHYNEYLLGSHESDTISMACRQYSNGLTWILDYYVNHHAHLYWHYSFHYSPSLLDLANYYNSGTTHTHKHHECFDMNDDVFVDIVQRNGIQLLCVLPPQSTHLLPTHLQQIVTNIDLGCVHYYPIGFKLTTFLKQYIWECGAMLPDVDIQHMAEVCASLSIKR